MKNPDWSEWSLMPKVEVWQAVALSMNLEPHDLRRDAHTPLLGFGSFFKQGSFASPAIEREFEKRLRILEANLENSEQFPDAVVNYGELRLSIVALPEFSAWAVSAGWDIPGKLLGVVKKSVPQKADLSESGGQDTQQVTENTKINRTEVISCFPVKRGGCDDNLKFWDDKLSRPPKWLKPAMIAIGKPGLSSLWDPLMIAHCLLAHNHMPCKQLDAAIRKNFPAMLEQWCTDTADKR